MTRLGSSSGLAIVVLVVGTSGLVPLRTEAATPDGAGAGTAQQSGDRESEGAQSPRGVDPEARRLFNEGLRQYQRGDFHDAIQSFESSYEISRAPGLLFNLGQSYRQAGDCARALTNYQEYLRQVPKAANRERVEARIDQMQTCVDTINQPTLPVLPPRQAEAATTTMPSAATVTSSVANLDDQRVPTHGFFNDHRTGIRLALLGGSVTLGLVGAWLVGHGTVATQQTSELFRTGGQWDQAASTRAHDAQVSTWTGIGLLGGATLSAAGAVWSLTRASDHPVQGSPNPMRRRWGATVAASALAMGVAGTFLIARSRETTSWVTDTFQQGGVWDQQIAQRQHDAQAEKWIGSALVGGAALAAVGAGWLLLVPDQREPRGSNVAMDLSSKQMIVQWKETF